MHLLTSSVSVNIHCGDQDVWHGLNLNCVTIWMKFQEIPSMYSSNVHRFLALLHNTFKNKNRSKYNFRLSICHCWQHNQHPHLSPAFPLHYTTSPLPLLLNTPTPRHTFSTGQVREELWRLKLMAAQVCQWNWGSHSSTVCLHLKSATVESTHAVKNIWPALSGLLQLLASALCKTVHTLVLSINLKNYFINHIRKCYSFWPGSEKIKTNATIQ